MPPSANERPLFAAAPPPPGRDLAVAAEMPYRLNLPSLPVIAFALLVCLGRHERPGAPSVARHLSQALCASIFAGLTPVGINGAVLVLDGPRLARALRGKCFLLVGRRCRCD